MSAIGESPLSPGRHVTTSHPFGAPDALPTSARNSAATLRRSSSVTPSNAPTPALAAPDVPVPPAAPEVPCALVVPGVPIVAADSSPNSPSGSWYCGNMLSKLSQIHSTSFVRNSSIARSRCCSSDFCKKSCPSNATPIDRTTCSTEGRASNDVNTAPSPRWPVRVHQRPASSARLVLPMPPIPFTSTATCARSLLSSVSSSRARPRKPYIGSIRNPSPARGPVFRGVALRVSPPPGTSTGSSPAW